MNDLVNISRVICDNCNKRMILIGDLKYKCVYCKLEIKILIIKNLKEI